MCYEPIRLSVRVGSASLALSLLGKVASPPSHSLGGYDDERTCHAVRKCSNGVCVVWINELIRCSHTKTICAAGRTSEHSRSL